MLTLFHHTERNSYVWLFPPGKSLIKKTRYVSESFSLFSPDAVGMTVMPVKLRPLKSHNVFTVTGLKKSLQWLCSGSILNVHVYASLNKHIFSVMRLRVLRMGLECGAEYLAKDPAIFKPQTTPFWLLSCTVWVPRSLIHVCACNWKMLNL